ncbi:MAG: TPM domain-containing protein [Flavobacteriales bacterium]|nr:TPM domain-containing protein [Flavobacteriales bacterium]
MNPESIFTPVVQSLVETAIKAAEAHTSCELRVHIEDECPGDPLDRAAFIFAELQMHKTELRNGILIYVALESRKTAIIGDVGINMHAESGYWDHIRDAMLPFFVNGKYPEGIVTAVEMVGHKMKAHYPVSHNDINELPNTISMRQNKKTT